MLINVDQRLLAAPPALGFSLEVSQFVKRSIIWELWLSSQSFLARYYMQSCSTFSETSDISFWNPASLRMKSYFITDWSKLVCVTFFFSAEKCTSHLNKVVEHLSFSDCIRQEDHQAATASDSDLCSAPWRGALIFFSHFPKWLTCYSVYRCSKKVVWNHRLEPMLMTKVIYWRVFVQQTCDPE